MMPPKKHPETPEEQSERFRREAEKLISSGAVDPTAGERALDNVVKKQAAQGAAKEPQGKVSKTLTDP